MSKDLRRAETAGLADVGSGSGIGAAVGIACADGADTGIAATGAGAVVACVSGVRRSIATADATGIATGADWIPDRPRAGTGTTRVAVPASTLDCSAGWLGSNDGNGGVTMPLAAGGDAENVGVSLFEPRPRTD